MKTYLMGGADYNGKTATDVYVDFESATWSSASDMLWYSVRDTVKEVVVDESFTVAEPVSLAFWFYGFSKADFTGLEYLDTSQVINMNYTFSGCSSVKSIDGIDSWDTSNVKTLYCAFYNCEKLKDLDSISSWETSNVTTLSYTFAKSNLKEVDALAAWDTSSVTSMYCTFYDCDSLANLDGLSAWDVSQTTDLRDMFYGCTELEDINGLSDWNTENVTSLQSLFYKCSELTSVDAVASWDTSNVTSMYCTFYNCGNLTEVNVSKWDTSKVTNMGYMFSGCTKIKTMYSDDAVFVTDAVTDSTNMFQNCSRVVGGNGTTYSSSKKTHDMAHVDTEDNPGYFTYFENCRHDYGTGTVIQEPTCTENGVRRYVCSRCGNTYDEPVYAHGHTIGTVNAVQATCTEDGHTKWSYCLVCGEVFEEEEPIPATGHEFIESVDGMIKTYTCIKCGYVMTEYINGVFQAEDGNWYYYANGERDLSYTGFATNPYGKWWVDNGMVRFNMTGILNDEKGAIGSTSEWYYVIDSKVQEDYTGVSNFANAYGWWYINNGKVDFSVNSVEENQYGWWNVESGKVVFSDTVAQNRWGWWYCTGGKVDFGFSGLGNHGNAYGWWYIDKGKVDFSVNTVAMNNYDWWYVEGGKVQFGYTGVSNYENPYGWWYIANGKVDFSANTVAQNQWGWWYVTGGKVQFGYTGVANYANPYGWWYVKNGKVDFTYTGSARNNYGTWNVVNGKVKF